MVAFDYRQALEIRDALARHGVRYLFIGKSGAILLGFPTRRRTPICSSIRSPENGLALVAAVRELGFALTEEQAARDRAGQGLRPAQERSLRPRPGLRAGRDRAIRGCLEAPRRGGRLPGMPPRRHHREQGGRRTASRTARVASAAALVPRVLEAASAVLRKRSLAREGWEVHGVRIEPMYRANSDRPG